MSVAERIAERGGIVSYRSLSRVVSRADLAAAVSVGDVERIGRGRYALPLANDAVTAAEGLNGVLSHTSAALAWGWAVKTIPTRPHVDRSGEAEGSGFPTYAGAPAST